ncbi:hypothetical protein ACFLZB_02255 [Nanoarchaeota archaeon]
MTKTQDGIKLNKIVRAVRDITGIDVRPGTNHKYVLNFNGLRPCPLDKSTHAENMVVPWLRQATGYGKKTVYGALRSGCW